ncbi:hypothetical protein RHODGE_RHODGE_02439 [Rhodoplanes serenus]|uniref:Uncharacterized protein n=1 Tax=Rhodoplanes serenus TaxID=200615 RepID=A0A3S4CHF8_9BRAD|nr:hypothetical protein [Rhodoplanes serenus]VCU09265.1 hypothetical protein RHODGE_RHODGE_02439 [Rhodoplanes serenus]
MSLLSRIRILPKILSVVLLLAAVAGAAAWHSGAKLLAIDTEDSRFIEEDADARVASARRNRAPIQVGLGVYRLNAETGSASSQVLASAQSLSGESNRLKLELSKFLSTVHA